MRCSGYTTWRCCCWNCGTRSLATPCAWCAAPTASRGCTRSGRLSIQQAAAHVLERYQADFPECTPQLERLPGGSSRKGSVTHYKYYDVDGSAAGSAVQTPPQDTPSSRRREGSHNERYREQHEQERRVRRRRARLMTAAEEAFTHITRLKDGQGPAAPMEPYEAAQAIFPTIARSLQRYLRATRQQPRPSVEAVLAHLAQCLAHDMSPRAFLERYLAAAPALPSGGAGEQNWTLGVVFQLRRHDVSLLCSVLQLPHFSLAEEIIDPKSNKFVLRLNSETSV
ncbi:vang-like protein 2 [Pollicipes pollicipes]|uniref:vang-like protein 2 n=1 Tax=Pollicipes pollicipes TaxID=41117 RepID=UPI0018854263|nr:vang-like protein 2 [Pollicipes pollicipes]